MEVADDISGGTLKCEWVNTGCVGLLYMYRIASQYAKNQQS